MSLVYLFVFPGTLFLILYALWSEWVDRKLYARFQNRIGPPIYQPIADVIKLLAKEEMCPDMADRRVFVIAPILAVASVMTAFLYIPIWSTSTPYSFQGDLIVVLYLLTLPPLAFFLGAWSSSSPFASVGSVRVITQLFAYEAPLIVVFLAPAILAGTWSISGITTFFARHPVLILTNIIGFGVSIVAWQGKLERIPFDIPEAETEIAAGSFVEYSGKLLAFIRLALDMEMVVGASLISAVQLGGSFGAGGIAGLLIYFAKTMFIVFLLALIKSVFARIRMDQMLTQCWKYLIPLSFVQILISIIVKEGIS